MLIFDKAQSYLEWNIGGGFVEYNSIFFAVNLLTENTHRVVA